MTPPRRPRSAWLLVGSTPSVWAKVYFSPGHETYPIYHNPTIQQVIANAVGWARAGEPSSVTLGIQKSEKGWFER